jgi:DNA (cytosine-5)-methyltransferase 1
MSRRFLYVNDYATLTKNHDRKRYSMTSVSKFASLFSGCGGFDLGFIKNGFQPAGAFDNDPEAVANYKESVSKRVTLADLTKTFDVDSVRSVDALIAGPPCQGFSTAGKRDLNDERNELLSLTGRLALLINPRVLVVENVPGSIAGKHSRYFDDLDQSMRAAGYRTHKMSIQVSKLGMAQLRRRILFFAWRTGRDITFPVPTGIPKDLRSTIKGACTAANHDPRFLVPETRDYLIARRIGQGQKLSNVRGGKNSVATWDIPEAFGAVTSNERTVLELVRLLRRQDRQRNYGDADPVSLTRLESALGEPFHSLVVGLIAKGYLRRVGSGIDLVGTFNGKFRRLCWLKPSYTVDTRFGSPRYFLHPTKQRGFTVREAARIQGFDDAYVFRGSAATQFRLLGNAVPPPLGTFAAEIACLLLKA